MNACMYVHLPHHAYEDDKQTKTMDHTSKPSLSKSPPADVEAMCFALGTEFYFGAFDFDINRIDADNFNPCSGLHQDMPRLCTLRALAFAWPTRSDYALFAYDSAYTSKPSSEPSE